ncbi:MAG TPA: GNAT family N-acetyltransferase [bacterium]|nr:GNAT family N-acetyltransferase [bacterium]
MESEIRLMFRKDAAEWNHILAHAYPDFTGPDAVKWMEESIEKRDWGLFYGAWRDEKLAGGMRVYPLLMNVRHKKIEADGLGFVAVDMLHRKQKVAKDLVMFFLKNARKSGKNMASLYPFRVDFYKKMGFGYGTRLYRLAPRPDAFRYFTDAGKVEIGDKEKDFPEMLECYNRFIGSTNGMCEMINGTLSRLAEKSRFIVYRNNNRIEGFMFYRFVPVGDKLVYRNNMQVFYFIHENPSAFKALSTFIAAQSDQIERILLQSHTPDIALAFSDPTNGHSETFHSEQLETTVTATAMMYRIIDFKRLIKESDGMQFGTGDLSVLFKIRDTFMPHNNGETAVVFSKGNAEISKTKHCDIEISIDISELATLFTGAATLGQLYSMGLAEVSNPERIHLLEKIIQTERPVCLTTF